MVGFCTGVGLNAIGVPNAFVWGVLTAMLRFVPFVGVWIAAVFPIALSLAVSPNWTMPSLTVGLFVIMELLCDNIVEPVLYGSSTGVSSIALILAAVFWTWIWGPAGLVLATPITVCLVVIGRHVPGVSIFSLLLSDEQALAPHEEFYHRLLNPYASDTANFATSWLKSNSQTALYDSVLIPALATIQRDSINGRLEKEQYETILQEMRDLIEEIADRPLEPSKIEADRSIASTSRQSVSVTGQVAGHVICLPVRSDRDEIAGLMLSQLLRQHHFMADAVATKGTSSDLFAQIRKSNAGIVCISVTPPSTIMRARYWSGELRKQFPKLRIIVGLWGATEQLTDAIGRLRASGADEVVTSLADAVLQCSKFSNIAVPAASEAGKQQEILISQIKCV